jgi:hypothetical protein
VSSLTRTVLISPPANVQAQPISATAINLTWNARNGATGYRIRRNGVVVGDSATTSFSNTGLTASTSYTFTVAALAITGEGPQGTGVQGTTLAAADTTPPTAPVITATATGSSTLSVALTTPATDTQSGVASYDLEYKPASAPTYTAITGLTAAQFPYVIGGLIANTQYNTRARARDGATPQNVGAYSALSNATTQAASGNYAPVSNGRLWVNINGPYDFLSEHMPLNIFKNARQWFADLPGGVPTPRAAGIALIATVLDADGYPTQIPAPLTFIETVLLSQQRVENGSELNGRYRFTFSGAGTYQILGGGVSNVTYSAGQAEFDYTVPATPQDGTIVVRITATTSGNHLRNMQMFKTEHAALVASGRLTRPNYPFNNVGCLRWMETQRINNDPYPRGAGQWPTPNTYSWDHRGISIEEICTAANETGVAPWICFHHTAADAYVEHIATVVRDNLNPALNAKFEYGNEFWNPGFSQYHWAYAQGEALLGPEAGGANWLQYAGLRGAQCMNIVASVFAGQMHRVTRVCGVNTGWAAQSIAQLDAPLWVALGNPAPHLSYDAIAVTAYWGSELQQDPAVCAALLTQLNISQAAAEAYMRDRYMPSSSAATALPELFSELDEHRAIADARNLDMLMYEGGTHFVLESSYQNHPTLQPFINNYNYSADIAEFYRLAAAKWDTIGDGGFNQFVTFGFPNRFGAWGMLRYWGDSNPRSQLILQYNSAPLTNPGTPTGGKTRDVYAFLNSLHNHDAGAGDANTSTGNWVRRMALQAPNGGNTYTLGWQFGFAAPGGWTTLPRSGQQEVAPNVYINDAGNPAWTGATNIEVVELVPDNFFGPLTAPNQPNVEGWTYTTRFLFHIDNWEANAPNPNRVYAVHGGWPLLSGNYGSVAGQTTQQRANYIAHALGPYQSWLDSLTSLLQAARPSLNIVQYGINRASMLAWRDTVVNTIPIATLFEDNAPHGRSTMYFLNAVANYIELFNEKPPANFVFQPSWNVSSVVTSNYQAIVDYIWSVLRP